MGDQRKRQQAMPASALYHRVIRGKEQAQTTKGYRGLSLENREQAVTLIEKQVRSVLAGQILLRSFYNRIFFKIIYIMQHIPIEFILLYKQKLC